jgi:hypothetical protein
LPTSGQTPSGAALEDNFGLADAAEAVFDGSARYLAATKTIAGFPSLPSRLENIPIPSLMIGQCNPVRRCTD